ncbi:MAG: hypothetical protein SPJ74_01890 [Bacilli bacterium]|nr:hypothetical protein [Bacilli bacterium]
MGKIIGINKKKKNKLKIENVNRNSSKNVSHTINKIKSNERKYTIILVFIFMILFIVICFFLFRVNGNKLYSSVDSARNEMLESSSRVITLTNDYILSDKVGLKTDKYVVTINNDIPEILNYKIKLVRDDIITSKCKCDTTSLLLNNIKYSLDGKNISTLVENNNKEIIITTGSLKSGENKKVNINLWIDENVSKDKEHHFHGYFKVERIEDINEN